jgi:hypothetical protein
LDYVWISWNNHLNIQQGKLHLLSGNLRKETLPEA